MRPLAFLLFLVLSATASAAAYRWVDENGQVHYSDRPRPDAEKVEIKDAQTFSAPRQVTRGEGGPARPAQAAAQKDVPPPYASMRVVRPSPEQTLHNIGGQLSVTLSLNPRLRPGHLVRVYYDGQPVASWPAQNLSHTLTDVYRGTHDLRAAVVDSAGNEIVSSESVRFYVRQTSILNRARN